MTWKQEIIHCPSFIFRTLSRYYKKSTTSSEEELVAEIAASFLGAQAGIDYNDIVGNITTYLQGWLKVLQKGKLFIFKAAAATQKAMKSILNHIK